jgi:hypothetical protein
VLDPATVDNINFRVACVYVGLCDKHDLSALLWILYCDNSGFWSRFDVSMEIEQTSLPNLHLIALEDQVGVVLAVTDLIVMVVQALVLAKSTEMIFE